jgi:hypothetical protein
VIRTNLSTRPFYNERAVHIWILVVAAVVIAATAFNVSRVVRYSRSDTVLGRTAAQNEARAVELRKTAARLRGSVDLKQVDRVSVEARQANDLIDRRTFSWTELWNLFEATLPDNVRIVAFRPRVDRKRGIIVTTNVVARSVDDVNDLMEKLESTGAFSSLLVTEDHVDDDGTLGAILEAVYSPKGGRLPAGPGSHQ